MTTAQMNDPERDGGAAVGIPVDRTVRLVLRAARWLVVMLAGVLLWDIGMVLLGVPAVLPPWRYVSGAALLARCPTGKCAAPARDCFGSGCLGPNAQAQPLAEGKSDAAKC